MKTQNYFKIFAFTLLLLVSVMAVSAAEGVYGYVTNSTGSALNSTNVTVAYYSNATVVNSTLSNESGFYNLTYDVESGNYTINFSAAGYVSSQYRIVVINNTEFQFDESLGPILPGYIYGWVTPNTATVRLVGPEIYTVPTDFSGFYNATVLPGSYSMTASSVGYNDGLAGATVTEGNQTEQNFTLTILPSTLKGYVSNYTNNSEFIEYVSVKIYKDGLFNTSTTTDASGYYEINLSNGIYNLSFTAVNYQDNNLSDVVVPVSSTTTQNITLIHKDATCTETSVATDWGDCIDGKKSRTVTYTNHNNVCGVTYVVIENDTDSCGGSTTPGSSRRSTGGVSPYITTFKNYVTHIWGELLPGQSYLMKADNKEIAIYEVEFTVTERIENGAMSVGVLIEDPSDPYEGPVYQYGDIIHQNIDDDQIEYGMIRFRIKEDWFGDNLDPDTVVLYRYNDGQWDALPTEDIGKDSDYYYYESETPGFSIYAISAEEFKEEEPVIEEEEEEPEEEPEEIEPEEEEEEETSALANAWMVLSNFAREKPSQFIIILVFIIALILLLIFRDSIRQYSAKSKQDKAAGKDAKKQAVKKQPLPPEYKRPNFFVHMWRAFRGYWISKDDAFFEVDVEDRNTYINKRRKARLERRKMYRV